MITLTTPTGNIGSKILRQLVDGGVAQLRVLVRDACKLPSAAGETPDRPAGPITALHRMEAILGESGAACRFLRCGSFLENLLWQWESITQQGRMVYPIPGDIPGPQRRRSTRRRNSSSRAVSTGSTG